jgi:3-oxoadipate enol-lactonase
MPLTDSTPRLSYTRAGPTGVAPLVLVNGLGGAQAAFALQAQHFSRTRDVVLYDHRGLGGSEPGPPAPTMRDYALDLVRLLDELGLGQVDLLGMSFGGRVALQTVLEWPERVGRLVLCGTSAGGAVHQPSVPAVAQAMRRLDRLDQDDWETTIGPALFGRLYRERYPERISALARWRARYPAEPEGIRRQWSAFDSFDVGARLDQVRVGCLVIHGEDDQVSPPGNGRWLAAHLPSAQLVLLDGIGHSPNVEDPKAFHAAIDAFLGPATQGG